MFNGIEPFLNKKMTRQEFIKHIGLVLLSLFGIANVLKYLSHGGSSVSHSSKVAGYGTSPYGGLKSKTGNWF